MNHRVSAVHRFNHLAEVLDITNQIPDRATLGARHSVKHGNFVSRVQQLLHDKPTDFALTAGNENLH